MSDALIFLSLSFLIHTIPAASIDSIRIASRAKKNVHAVCIPDSDSKMEWGPSTAV